MLFAIPSARLVPGVNQIVKKNGLETAEAKYDGVWGVGDDKNQKVDQGNSGPSKNPFCFCNSERSISGQSTLHATLVDICQASSQSTSGTVIEI